MTAPYTISVRSAGRTLATLIDKAKESPVEITRYGRVEAVLVSPRLYARMKNLGLLNAEESNWLQDQLRSLVGDMSSERSSMAYEALNALGSADLPAAVSEARRLMALRASAGKAS